MLTIDVSNFIKEHFPEFKFYTGRMGEAQKEKLFRIKKGISAIDRKPAGNTGAMSYSRLAVNCIIHWNKNYKQTEEKANEIYEFLFEQEKAVIGGYTVKDVVIRNFLDIGSDSNDIYEFAIDFEVIYDRNKAEKEGE